MARQFKYISQETINEEEENDYIKLETILTEIIKNIKKSLSFDRTEALKAINLLNGFSIAHNLNKINLTKIPKTQDGYVTFLTDYLEELLLDDSVDMYADFFTKKATGKLSDQEYYNIQDMVNNIKKTVNSSTTLDKKLKQMILDKINELISALDQSLTKLEKTKLIVSEINGMIKATHDDVLKPMSETLTNFMNKLNPLKKENKQIGYKQEIVDVEVTEIGQIEDKIE